MATIAINGLGRIGRAAFKIILETPELELRAVEGLRRFFKQFSFPGDRQPCHAGNARFHP